MLLQQEKCLFVIKYFHRDAYILFTCTENCNFAKILAEMKRVLIFAVNIMLCVGLAYAGVRDGTAVLRAKTDKTISQSRVSTVAKRASVPRSAVLTPRKESPSRGSNVAERKQNARGAVVARSANVTVGRGASGIVGRNGQNLPRTSIIEETPALMSSTRTGAEYERCKNTYFSCMDQFCMLKNDDYRRCSCNDRVFALDEERQTLQSAGEKITVFNEQLDVVGMTASQAEAMRKESEGEQALTGDNSASKALLQAIMNSIRGEDGTVAGKYAGLNSVNISFDTVNAFGMTDIGQAIASYNGNALYSAVYPQCRDAVRADCNDASLQRAITAYLMAVEQDCNTVQTALEQTRKKTKAAVRESSAMLDLARVENRQKHNSSDITTCVNDVETAILSEEVCGAGYHKCLDNGEYIDISTGKPIAGVKDFYKLGDMLKFSDGVEAVHQKLSKNSSNRMFVQNFESRVKMFAMPALDKCVEDADFVWAEYLDRAMLSIYYAQKSKVEEIKQGCFDYVSSCYMSTDDAISGATDVLTGDSSVLIQPDKIALNNQMCTDYIESCNNMFDNNIIADYIENITNTDTLTACRAVVKQCFDKYGGMNYENFYYPYSGLFAPGSAEAPDWFTLYTLKTDENGRFVYETNADGSFAYKSECAKQLQTIPACSSPEIIERAFGGLDYRLLEDESTKTVEYGVFVVDTGASAADTGSFAAEAWAERNLRSTGVATEVYNQIISILTTQCMNLQGRFVEVQFMPDVYEQDNYCVSNFNVDGGKYQSFVGSYGIGKGENMCPRDYSLGVATQSWGACLCWENGGRRSKWGKAAKCMPVLPVDKSGDDIACSSGTFATVTTSSDFSEDAWCVQDVINKGLNQVCPLGGYVTQDVDNSNGYCAIGDDNQSNVLLKLPEGVK